MFLDVNNFLDITERQVPKDLFLHVADGIDCNGDFFLHHFISLFLKREGSVCLVSVAQTLHHYLTVARKLGVNLQTAQSDGRFITVDCLTTLSLGHAPAIIPAPTSTNERTVVSGNSATKIRKVYETVKEAVDMLRRNPGPDGAPRPVCVIIDDLTAFLSLGYSPVEIADFAQYCNIQVCKSLKGCLVTLGHFNSDAEDNEQELLYNILQYRADIRLRVEGLDTGFSMDVHGQVNLQRNDTDKVRKVHYKAVDNNVSLFAMGTSSAVL